MRVFVVATAEEEELLRRAVEGTKDLSSGGQFYVLGGVISPMDGIGPAKLNMSVLNTEADEVVLALPPTLEGEATAMYLAERLQRPGRQLIRVARQI